MKKSPLLCYKGGSSPITPRTFPNILDWTARVTQKNQCKAGPRDIQTSPSVRRLAFTNCAQNPDVILYTLEGGGHTWPDGKPLPEWIVGRTTPEISASRVMWQFYVQHPRAQQ